MVVICQQIHSLLLSPALADNTHRCSELHGDVGSHTQHVSDREMKRESAGHQSVKSRLFQRVFVAEDRGLAISNERLGLCLGREKSRKTSDEDEAAVQLFLFS